MNYISTKLKHSLSVNAIISIHYFEYTPEFAYSGEAHDFWELILCDKGRLIIKAGDRELVLEKGQAYLHPPMQYHNVRAYGDTSANSVILSFESPTRELESISDKILVADDYTVEAFFSILKEARGCFSNPQGKVIDPKLIRKSEEDEFGAEQLIQNYTELLLIHLVRKALSQAHPAHLPAAPKSHDLADDISEYMKQNLSQKIVFSDVSKRFSVSPTTLKKLFRDTYGHGVMEHLTHLRLDTSKELLRSGKHSCTEIAAMCGFCSVHHYSNVFKKRESMSPSEYVRSIKSMLESVE